ncbi:hypothetical protein LINPERPRIM_LOCUS11837 [Linum perenne]
MGLERAWEAGIRQVEVQTDSTCAIRLLSEADDLNNQHVVWIVPLHKTCIILYQD